MNAKGETLRPSSVWEALPSRSSLGSSAWKPWEQAQELPGPFWLGGHPLTEVWMALAPPRSLCALGVAPRTMRVT